MIKYVLIFLVGSIAVDLLFRRKNSVAQGLLDSAHNAPGGFSMRKVHAYIAIFTAVYIAARHALPEQTVELVGIFLLFAAVCAGIVTIEQIIKFKSSLSGSVSTEKTVSTETTSSVKEAVIKENG